MALIPTFLTTPTSNSKSDGTGALSSLDKSTYDFDSTRYPEDVGTIDVPHYVVFNINLPTNSKYTDNAGGSIANVQSSSTTNYNLVQSQGGQYQASPAAAAGGSAARSIVGGSSATQTAIGSGLNAGGAAAFNTVDLKPKLNRVKKAIAIYMPDTVFFQYGHDWQTSHLTEALGSIAKNAALGQGLKNIGENIADTAGAIIRNESLNGAVLYNNAQGAEGIGEGLQLAGATSDINGIILQSINKAVNPQVEMVFRGTQNRMFEFVFDFQPRSSSESAMIIDILKTFRMYAAPEISDAKDNNGRYFIPPAQFDISFYFKDKQSDVLPKISTCALSAIQVDYNRAGKWATFDDGMPVHINARLEFKEMDIITRELIENFGY